MLCECIYRIAGAPFLPKLAFDHRMLAVVRPDWTVLAQFNGLASRWDQDLQRWQPIPIGYRGHHRLRLYVSGWWGWGPDDTIIQRDSISAYGGLPIYGCSQSVVPNLKAAVRRGLIDVAAGADGALKLADMVGMGNALLQVGSKLGSGPITDPAARGISYPRLGLGQNSNTMVTTLRRSLGLAVTPGRFGAIALGQNWHFT